MNDCKIPTHAHYKWPCPKSNGRHEWLIEWRDIVTKIKLREGKVEPVEIGIPVKCGYDCGAFATEWYEFKEIIEGE